LPQPRIPLCSGELDPIFESPSNRSHGTSTSEKGPAGEGGSSSHGGGSSAYRPRNHSSPDRGSKSAPSPRNSLTNTHRLSGSRTSPSPTHHSNPNALHSIRYNITHRLSDAEVFSSTGAKILVVEDSPAQRKMLVKRLHVADPTWDVSQAVSGEDALAKLQAARWMFDVVFVDENLSVEDGLFGHELVHLMRRQSQMSTSVIIACTSNPAKVTDKLLAAGVDYVWPKPPPLPSVIKPKIDSLLAARIKAFAAQVHPTSNGNSMNADE
jgi:CheY-like chemotaxis protein